MGDKGRPKITTESFPEGWESELISIGEQGGSDVEMRAFLNGICHETWERLLREDSQFSETVKRARLLCQVWWEKNGRLNLDNKEFSYTGWYMNMKNRFGWKDKQEVAQDITSNGKDVGLVVNFVDTKQDRTS